MPRAVDIRPLQATHDPTRSGTEFHIQGLMLSEAEVIAQLLAQVGEGFTNGVMDLLEALTGIDFSSAESFLEGLSTLIGVPLAQFAAAFESIDFSSPTAFLTSLAEALMTIPAFSALGELIYNLINGGQPVNVGNLFGQIRESLLSLVSSSSIGSINPNLITDPLFAAAAALVGEGIWSWDVTEGQTGAGSAKVTANGSVQSLLSNLIPVVPTQIVNLKTWTKWAGLSYTGSPISLMAEVYDADGAVIATPLMKAATVGSFSSSWVQLVGNPYTVPTNAASMRMRLNVGTSATAGSVWFDNVSFTKTNLIPQNQIHDLPSALAALLSIDSFDELVDVIGGSFGDTVDAVEDRLNAFLHGLSPLNASNINTGNIADAFVQGVRDILDNLGGIITGLGGTNWTHAMSAAAIRQQADALTGANAAIARHEALLTGGVSAQDLFERTGSNPGTDWTSPSYSSGAGNVECDGHNLVWDKGFLTSAERTFKMRWQGTNTQSQTNNQKAAIVLASQPEDSILGSAGRNDILLRCDSALSNYIRFSCDGKGLIAIIRCLAGTEVVLLSDTFPILGNSSSFGAQAGKPGTARYFAALINGFAVLEVTDSTSQLGASYTYWGLGGKAGSNPLLVTQNAMGKVKQWTAADL